MMSRWLTKLWQDDCGALIASELLFLMTILVVGTISGMAAMRQAIVSELIETANAVMALNQSYSFSGQSIPGVASTAGSATGDTNNTISVSAIGASPAVISQTPCE
jgi:hypothetical protein